MNELHSDSAHSFYKSYPKRMFLWLLVFICTFWRSPTHFPSLTYWHTHTHTHTHTLRHLYRAAWHTDAPDVLVEERDEWGDHVEASMSDTGSSWQLPRRPLWVLSRGGKTNQFVSPCQANEQNRNTHSHKQTHARHTGGVSHENSGHPLSFNVLNRQERESGEERREREESLEVAERNRRGLEKEGGWRSDDGWYKVADDYGGIQREIYCSLIMA